MGRKFNWERFCAAIIITILVVNQGVTRGSSWTRRIKRQTPAIYCEGQADGTFFSDPEDCREYIMCNGQVDYRHTCPSGLYFSAELQTCVFDKTVCEATAGKSSGTSEINHLPSASTVDSGGLSTEAAEVLENSPIVSVEKAAKHFNAISPDKLVLTPQDKETATQLMEEMMPGAIQDAMTSLMHQLEDEAKLTISLQGLENGINRPFKLVQQFLKSRPLAKQLSLSAFILTNASLNLLADLGLDPQEYSETFKSMASPLPENTHRISADEKYPQPEPGTCPWPKYACSDSKYRSMDGSCNNLQNAIYGRAFTPLRRELSPDYSDGQRSMRKAKSGKELPAARRVSFTVNEDRDAPHQIHTLLVMQWGQFLDHDLTHTALSKLATEPSGYGKTADIMCGRDGCDRAVAACEPILIPSNDPNFFGKKCLEFVRSQETPNLQCKIGPREQLNQITSYLDSSQVYGSSKEEAEKLRDLSQADRGRMKTVPNPSNGHLKDMLPLTDADEECEEADSSQKCFAAGDDRVNEQNALTVLHTVWMREHNRIEEKLHAVNPQWSGETLYQETRRIINAMMQHITYNEFLPLVLGVKNVKQFGLELLKSGHYTGYDATKDASISNVFATAAYRFGHTLLTPNLMRLKKGYTSPNPLDISQAFFRPRNLFDAQQGGIDAFMRGLAGHRIQSYDRFVTKKVTVHLFADHPPSGLGTDLVSLNIQRGRDHGIPGYNAWREWCGLKRANTFDDLKDTIPNDGTRRKLQSLYEHVDDIDLFPAGISESPSDGALIGPTFACIIGRQFQRTRKGDRYWYENTGTHMFTKDQLASIRQVSLAKVFCENADNIPLIQPWAMEVPFREAYPTMESDKFKVADAGLTQEWFSVLWMSDYNKRVNCSCIPDVDLSKWRQ